MSEAVLLRERRDDILLLTMNRPERHNALNAELVHELGLVVHEADAAGIKVIVLTGAGEKAFCAGGDMLEMSGVESAAAKTERRDQIMDGYTELGKAPMPIIAAINGYCYGGGARLAIACDIRLAARSATFRFPGSEYGLVVGAAHLPRIVGASRAKDWLFTARRFDAVEALASGFVSSLYEQHDLLPAALSMAEVIAQQSVSAIRESKRIIDMATLSDDAATAEVGANRKLRGSPEQVERFRRATKNVTGR